MTERLADISARIDGIRQLGAVVNAMKGIAASRAHVARAEVASVDSYTATIAAGLANALGADTTLRKQEPEAANVKSGLLVFGAEQGFAGAFSERVLDSIGDISNPETLFLIGTRCLSVIDARGVTPTWTAALPSHTPGIPKLSDRITHAIYDAVGKNDLDRLDVVYTGWKTGRPQIVRQGLFPLDLSDLPPPSPNRPLTQVADETLITDLSRDFFHALVCKAALHAFAAENQARMEAMTAAASQIARELDRFQATLRRVRQEDITAEIIELGTGAAARNVRKTSQN